MVGWRITIIIMKGEEKMFGLPRPHSLINLFTKATNDSGENPLHGHLRLSNTAIIISHKSYHKAGIDGCPNYWL